MAVTISSKFYQDSEWKDISKVVFTSPNIDSPATAGTRSHILPGQGNLGLWYEDTSSMYIIEPSQAETTSDFYNYRANSSNTISTISGVIEITDVTPESFVTYINSYTGVPLGDADEITWNVSKIYLDGNLLSAQEIEDLLTTTRDLDGDYSTSKGFTKTVIAGQTPELVFEFDVPRQITSFRLKEYTLVYQEHETQCSHGSCWLTPVGGPIIQERKYINGYTIYGSNDNSSWTQIITSSTPPTQDIDVYTYISDKYKYIKLKLNTAPESPYETDEYGIDQIRFFTQGFTLGSSDKYLPANIINDDGDVVVVYVSYAQAVQSSVPINASSSADITVSGTIGIDNLVSGTNYYCNTWSAADINDYTTSALCEASTISGTGTSVSGLIYSSVDNYFTYGASASVHIVGNEINYTCSKAIDSDINTVDYTGTSTITYSTIASGTIASGASLVDIEGTTTRSYSETKYERVGSYNLYIDSDSTEVNGTVTSGTIHTGNQLNIWGWEEDDRITGSSVFLDMDTHNSVVFEISQGEAYNCRLTAWDDVTHSTLLNELIQGDNVRVSALAYCCKGDKIDPTISDDPINFVHPPARNIILKGNTVAGDTEYYYGDFNMVHRTEAVYPGVYGDFLMFKPMLYNITSSISYGVHDYIIAFHYSYT